MTLCDIIGHITWHANRCHSGVVFASMYGSMDTGPLIAEVAKGCKTRPSKTLKRSLHKTRELKNISETSWKHLDFKLSPLHPLIVPSFSQGTTTKRRSRLALACKGLTHWMQWAARCMQHTLPEKKKCIPMRMTSNGSNVDSLKQISKLSQGTSSYFWGPRLLEAGWKCSQSRRTERWSKASQRHLKHIQPHVWPMWPLDLIWPVNLLAKTLWVRVASPQKNVNSVGLQNFPMVRLQLYMLQSKHCTSS